MIAQLELILDEERIQISMDRKIKRLGDRLNLIPDKVEDKPSAINCGDCIHINIPDEEEPCRDCRDGLGNFAHFEAKDRLPIGCMHCKFQHTAMNNYPCNDCVVANGVGFSQFKRA
jgi:hypothetical protein